MKRSSFSILYYIRESRIKKDGTAGIEVKISFASVMLLIITYIRV